MKLFSLQTYLHHVTVILAIMEQLASTLREVIPAFAKEDGKAMIVTKVKLSIFISMGKERQILSTTSFQELLHPFYDLGLYLVFQSNPIWPYYGRHPPPPPKEAEALVVDLDLVSNINHFLAKNN